MENLRSILITGGTGSFGRMFLPTVLANKNFERIIIFSRDEMKQWDLMKRYGEDPRIRFFLGDVRDKSRLKRAMQDIDVVIHAAALKIVPIAEYNPFEAVKTNINGAMNIIDAAIDQGVKKVIALSTDKASSPVNLYGATKLASDKLFIAANAYSGSNGTKLSVVRYGNVMGSRGSVIPFFHQRFKNNEELLVTDPLMTRFMISLEEAVDLVWTSLDDMMGGEIYVKKIPSMNIVDIVEAISGSQNYKLVGIRPGEKLHEQMIGKEDAPFTYEYIDYYKILPNTLDQESSLAYIKNGKKVDPNFEYKSDKNVDWMSKSELQRWIKKNVANLNVF